MTEKTELTDFQLLVRRVADTEDGMAMFKILKDNTFKKGAYATGSTDGMKCALDTAWLCGQTDLVRSLWQIIEMDTGE